MCVIFFSSSVSFCIEIVVPHVRRSLMHTCSSPMPIVSPDFFAKFEHIQIWWLRCVPNKQSIFQPAKKIHLFARRLIGRLVGAVPQYQKVGSVATMLSTIIIFNSISIKCVSHLAALDACLASYHCHYAIHFVHTLHNMISFRYICILCTWMHVYV